MKIWKDPVWSKIIAAIISLAAAVAWRAEAISGPSALCLVIVISLECILFWACKRPSRLVSTGGFYYGEGQRRLLRRCIILVPLAGCAFLFLPILHLLWTAQNQKGTNSRHFTIAVAQFEKPTQPDSYRVTRSIRESLESLASRYPEIKIVSIDHFIDWKAGKAGVDSIENEARRLGASLVIWGDYDTTSKSVIVSTNFKILYGLELPRRIETKLSHL